jgi:hypothetical protein
LNILLWNPSHGRHKNCLWRPCLLTDRDNISHLYRGPVIDTSYQGSIHLANQFQRRFVKIGLFYKQKKNCLWRPCEGFQYSPLKPLCKMNWNLVGSISSWFVNKQSHHMNFWFGQFLKIFSETALSNEPKLSKKHLCEGNQVSAHLAKQFQRIFLEIAESETRIAYIYWTYLIKVIPKTCPTLNLISTFLL